jgi:hypothetical protein
VQAILRGTEITVKITFRQDEEPMRLKLEGKVIGPGTQEFERVWRSLEHAMDSRKLLVDLGGVIYMDAGAQKLLAEIYRQTGAEFVADTPMTKYFAEEARQAKEQTFEED